jgi:poly(hydroxyalkanoate) depolymerase family esterase
LEFKMPDDMNEATRLTREGRLMEATSLIQRLLRGTPVAPASEPAAAPPKAKAPLRKADAVDIEPEIVPRKPASEKATKRGLLAKILGKGAAPADVKAEPASGLKRDARGAFLARSYSNEAGTRAYRLYVPSSYAGRPVPLIVMLHGCTQSAEDFAKGTGMNELAEAETCLVAYPEQSKSANPNRCWNWFNPRDQKRDSGEPSIVAGIVREIAAAYAVDPARIYVAGLSAGGAAAAVLGSAYPDLFAAVGVHSGLPAGSAKDVGSALAAMRSPRDPSGLRHAAVLHGRGRLVPTIVFHGDKDQTVHPSNGQHVIAQSRTREWDALRAVSNSGRVPGGHAYTRTDHHDAAGRVVLELWEVHGAGHAWSGGKPEGSYTDPLGPDASREMLRFFMKHRASKH